MFSLNRVWQFGWSPSPKVHFAIAVSLTVIALVLSFVLYWNTQTLVSNRSIVEGFVVQSIGNEESMHTPIIEYTSLTGEKIRFKAKLASQPQRYFVGDKVQVILTGSEQTPKLMSIFTLYGFALFSLFFGSICALGSIGIYYLRVKPIYCK